MLPDAELYSEVDLYWFYQGFTPAQLDWEELPDMNEADLNPEEDFSDGEAA